MAAYRPIERLCVHGGEKEGSTFGLIKVFLLLLLQRGANRKSLSLINFGFYFFFCIHTFCTVNTFRERVTCDKYCSVFVREIVLK
jgi:hypothetical protein